MWRNPNSYPQLNPDLYRILFYIYLGYYFIWAVSDMWNITYMGEVTYMWPNPDLNSNPNPAPNPNPWFPV